MAAVEAIEDEHFTRKALALRAKQALAGRIDWRAVLADVAELETLLDGPHRALYALARFEETTAGQLALPFTDARAVA